MRSHSLMLLSGTVLFLQFAFAQEQPSAVASNPEAGAPSRQYLDWERRAGPLILLIEQSTGQLYRDLYESLGLGLDDSDELTRMLSEVSLLTQSWSTFKEKINHRPTASDIRRAESIIADVESKLGPERFAKFVEYRKTLNERRRLIGLSNRLQFYGVPLSAEQKDRLVQIMVGQRHLLDPAKITAVRGSFAAAQERVAQLDNYDDRLQEAYRSVLLPNQIEGARMHFLEGSDSRHRALRRFREQIAAGAKSPGFIYVAD